MGGEEIPFSDFSTPEQIGRAGVRLAVAGGLAKAKAIYAVLQTGLINVLITDERTAEELIALQVGKSE